jgi:NAD(P)-dependent dehydrogenase (short-subunit alcohol dehydrogenase family)
VEIAGKVFIVTGGASGLGEGTARMLAAQGGQVVIADMQVDKGEAVAREIGGTFVRCDVSSEADGQLVVDTAVAPASPPPKKPLARTALTPCPPTPRPSWSTWWAPST